MLAHDTLRQSYNADWIALVFAISLFLLCLSVLASKHSLMQQWRRMRVERFDSFNGRLHKISISRLLYYGALLLLLSLLYCFLIAKAGSTVKEQLLEFARCGLIVVTFFLVKHYATKLYFNLAGSEERWNRVAFYTARFKKTVAYILWPLLLVFYYGWRAPEMLWGIAVVLTMICSAIYVQSLYRCRKTVFSMSFTFILYLCALEILPYFLLLKYGLGSVFEP